MSSIQNIIRNKEFISFALHIVSSHVTFSSIHPPALSLSPLLSLLLIPHSASLPFVDTSRAQKTNERNFDRLFWVRSLKIVFVAKNECSMFRYKYYTYYFLLPCSPIAVLIIIECRNNFASHHIYNFQWCNQLYYPRPTSITYTTILLSMEIVVVLRVFSSYNCYTLPFLFCEWFSIFVFYFYCWKQVTNTTYNKKNAKISRIMMYIAIVSLRPFGVKFLFSYHRKWTWITFMRKALHVSFSLLENSFQIPSIALV